MTRSPPKQKPGRSVQDVQTPPEFIEALTSRFGSIDFDLAATKENAVAKRFYTPEDDSLSKDWNKLTGTLYLNCPFGKMKPWVTKAVVARYRPDWLLMLMPASVAANWWVEDVAPYAFVLTLSPRITFAGHSTGFPRDLALACFGFGGVRGFENWRWDAHVGGSNAAE